MKLTKSCLKRVIGTSHADIILACIHWYLCPVGTAFLAMAMPKIFHGGTGWFLMAFLLIVSAIHARYAGQHLDDAFARARA